MALASRRGAGASAARLRTGTSLGMGKRSRCALLAIVVCSPTLSCAPIRVAPTPPPCSTTPISELVLVDGSKWGQRGGEVFFQTAGPPDKPPYRHRAAPALEKILVILTNPLPSPTPNDVEVRGRELFSGGTATFKLNQTLTIDVPYGAQWGHELLIPDTWLLGAQR